MSDETTKQATDAPPPTPPTTEADKPDPIAELEKWRALARKHEAEAKRNAEAAAKLKALEDAQKSEIERIREAAELAKREAEQARTEALRWRVAARLQLPAQLASRLQGTSEEEIEADAKELLAAISKGAVRDLPKDSTVSGATGTPASEGEELDPRKLASRITSRW
jgi:hypothetical protein